MELRSNRPAPLNDAHSVWEYCNAKLGPAAPSLKPYTSFLTSSHFASEGVYWVARLRHMIESVKKAEQKAGIGHDRGSFHPVWYRYHDFFPAFRSLWDPAATALGAEKRVTQVHNSTRHIASVATFLH